MRTGQIRSEIQGLDMHEKALADAYHATLQLIAQTRAAIQRGCRHPKAARRSTGQGWIECGICRAQLKWGDEAKR